MSWKFEYAFLLFISTLSVFILGKLLEVKKLEKYRKFFLALGLVFIFMILFVFKYFNFFVDIFVLPFDVINLLLPVGISFYTFQATSYLIDVYKKEIASEKSFVIFALYVSFFPQLIAGPIERASHLIPQFKTKKSLKLSNFVKGFRLILWGYFLKILIADRVGLFVDPVYSDLTVYSGSTILLATYFFAIQIYCDFAGYSFIAVGVARVLGFDLMYNFRRPYFSQSISEFWRRWHISLYDWFRDYVYIPLGGSRVKFLKLIFNILLVFLISGLWHGAALTFVVWGLLHGVYLVVAAIKSKIFGKAKLKVSRFATCVRVMITFHLVCFSWIFFRASSLADAKLAIEMIIKDFQIIGLSDLAVGPRMLENSLTILFIFLMFVIHFWQEKRGEDMFKSIDNKYVRSLTYVLMIVMILCFGVFDNKQFIYFTF